MKSAFAVPGAAGVRQGVLARSQVEPSFLHMPRLLPRLLLVLCLMRILMWGSSGLGALFCILASFHALRGARQTVEALGVLAFLLLLGGGDVSTARWLVLFAGMIRVVWDSAVLRTSVPRIFWYFLVFFITLLLFSILASFMPIVSILKLVSFTVGVGTALISFHRTRELRDYWLAWFFTLGIFILYASLPLYVTGGGYERTSIGFQGILSHPQTYGPVLAPLAALFTGQVLFGGDRRWYVQVAAVMAWGGIFMSSSRTALLATILSGVVSVAAGLLTGRKWHADLAGILLKPTTLYLMLIVCFLVVMQWGRVNQAITGFMLKDDGSTGSITESLESSRGELIDKSMENFRREPITGIGFGIPSDAGQFEGRIATGFLGLPTSASVEKGFMPSAVLEEIGAVGGAFVLLLLFLLVQPIIRGGYITFLWMVTACLTINLGEMVFFSVGGMGLYFWLLMSFLHTTTAEPLRSPVS